MSYEVVVTHILNSGDVIVGDLVGLLAELDQVPFIFAQFLSLQVPLDFWTDSLVTAQVAKVAFLVSAAGSAQVVSMAIMCASSCVDPQILL